jgi:hypothetical protein
MGCAPAAGLAALPILCFGLTPNHAVLRAPPVPAFYDYLKSVGGGFVFQRPFNVSKRPMLLYDDDTTLDFEQVSFFSSQPCKVMRA